MLVPEVHDIRRFGAAGDGSTDDTRAIQAAIDRAAEAGGGVVYVPPGSYRVTAQGEIGCQAVGRYCLDLRGGVTLLGVGPASRIRAATSQVTAVVARGAGPDAHLADVRIANLRISGSDVGNGGGAAYGRGIFFWRTDRSVVEGCELDGFRVAFQADRLSADRTWNREIVFRGNRVHDLVGTRVGNGSGAFASGTEGLEVRDNRFYALPEHCIYIGQAVRNFRIVGNECRSGNGSPPDSGIPLGFGIQLFSAAAGHPVTDGLVFGNTIIGGDQGVYLQPQQGGREIRRVSIIGNTVSDTARHGIHLIDAAECVVSGNVVRGAGAGGAGIIVEGGEALLVGGNICTGNSGAGIVVAASPGTGVVGNTCLDNGGSAADGIAVGSGSARCRLVGNLCSGRQRYGINIGDPGSSGCAVVGNRLDGNLLAEVNDASGAAGRS